MRSAAKRLAAVLVLLISTTTQAAYFSGNAYFSQSPVSQMGPVVFNNLAIVNGPFSYTVSGVVHVQVPAGAVSGTLIEWNVDRLLDPTYGSSNMITTTTLNGFASPPSGTFTTTYGTTYSYLDQYPIVSKSNIPLTLTNGAALWNQITVQSTTFPYTSANGLHYVRQRFELDAVKLTGPSGVWIIDMPLTTTVTPIPEPVSASLWLGGMALLVHRRRANAC